MASRCSSLSLPWLLLLLLVILLGNDDAVAAMVMPRPLLGIAEPPTVLMPGTAAGPGSGASRPGGRGGRRPDWSMAGAEVILAGFAAAAMVIVFCYIRITRKNNSTCNGSSDVRVNVMGVGVGKQQQQQRL